MAHLRDSECFGVCFLFPEDVYGGSGMEEQKTVRKLSRVSVFGNVILFMIKMFTGIAGNSGAMVSDAVHSLSDVFTTIVAYIGVRLSKREEDREHPYGHERLECVASLILGLILAGTGIGIGYSGLRKLISPETLEIPTLLPLIAAIISIIVKEMMFRYTMYHAKKLDSSAFKADAWHHRSDALSSIGSFVGIGLARIGFPFMDPLASLVICIFILKVAFDISLDAIARMLDTSCDKETELAIRDFIEKQPGVVRVDLLQTRLFGNKIYVDLEIAADGNISLHDAHAIAENVHDGIEQKFPAVKHVMIHVNPAD